MKSCVYDNPDTCRREWWVEGRLQSFVTMELFFLSDSCKKGWPRSAMECTAIPFVKGQMEGDPRAMLETQQ